MKENSPVSQLGNFVDRPWGVSEIVGKRPGAGRIRSLLAWMGYPAVM